MSEDYTKLRMRMHLTTHDGITRAYSVQRILGKGEAQDPRIMHYLQMELAKTLIKRNEFFGSTIGPLRITEEPYTFFDVSDAGVVVSGAAADPGVMAGDPLGE